MDVTLYDTTLRDGTQREGLSLSAEDKVKIARRLDALGVSYIEGGWPGSNPDRKSTRVNSSHGYISYAVFCLKKKKNNTRTVPPRTMMDATHTIESQGPMWKSMPSTTLTCAMINKPAHL